ncbi:hypothetical protein QFZ81_000498 [Paenibacillus sp. V4I9]|uniref:hypothetical protein n=1 Tax=Paenibacillus sp. V4I9 TaxID=3042308 RepID=UPI002786F046|nr:hypothetical protein [Paenibacillus sp. V4I9]MDQ0885410.1 hypothetical protein [Paenibacillus sp. V4I9]
MPKERGIKIKKIIIILLLLGLTACKTTDSPILKPITISQAYPGSIMNVSKIELIDGSSGERIKIENKKEIDQFSNEIKDLVLDPEKNQEGRTGYIFRVALYEGNELKMDFIPTSINRTYYKLNEQLNNKLKEIFTKKFNRQF